MHNAMCACRQADNMNLHWSMRGEAALELEKRDEVVVYMPGQPLDLRAAACMFNLDPADPLRVWQASGKVVGIPTTAQIALKDMCNRTGQDGSDARPFLLQGRPAQGKHSAPPHLPFSGAATQYICHSHPPGAPPGGGGGGWD